MVLAKATRSGRPVYDIKNLCNDKSIDAKNEDSLRKVDLKKTKVKYIRGLLGFAGNYEFRNVGEMSQRGTRYGSVKFQLKAASAGF